MHKIKQLEPLKHPFYSRPDGVLFLKKRRQSRLSSLGTASLWGIAAQVVLPVFLHIKSPRSLPVTGPDSYHIHKLSVSLTIWGITK